MPKIMRKKSSNQTGFTLIELLLVIGLFGVLMTIALFFSMDFFRTYASNSEQATLVSALSKARAQSLANINHYQHGVRVAPDGYTIFEGPTGGTGSLTWDNRISASDQFIPVNSGLTPTTTTDIVFAQLIGTTSCSTPCDVTLSGNGGSETITINSAGAILW